MERSGLLGINWVKEFAGFRSQWFLGAPPYTTYAFLSDGLGSGVGWFLGGCCLVVLSLGKFVWCFFPKVLVRCDHCFIFRPCVRRRTVIFIMIKKYPALRGIWMIQQAAVLGSLQYRQCAAACCLRPWDGCPTNGQYLSRRAGRLNVACAVALQHAPLWSSPYTGPIGWRPRLQGRQWVGRSSTAGMCPPPFQYGVAVDD